MAKRRAVTLTESLVRRGLTKWRQDLERRGPECSKRAERSRLELLAALNDRELRNQLVTFLVQAIDESLTRSLRVLP